MNALPSAPLSEPTRPRPAFFAWTRRHRRHLVPAILAVAFLLLYGLLVEDVLLTGDSAVYNQQIERHELGIRTAHIGYFLLGLPATLVSPLSTDLTMNYVMALLACGTLLLLYAMIRDVTGSLGLAPMFLLHAVNSHYLMPQTFAVTASYFAWRRERALLSGALFPWALLITPTSALALPGYLIGRVGVRKTISFGLAWAPAYALVVWFLRHDLLWGPRGVFASGLRDSADDVSL